MRHKSIILRTDSYKPTHWPVYPEGSEFMYSYMESRGGVFPTTVFFGLNFYAKEYLTVPVTHADIDYALSRLTKHYGDSRIINLDGWRHIVDDHGGLLPIRIKAVPEGTVVPTNNVLMTIENTCPKCAWVVNYVETLLMKVWYPITVATQSREIKKIINDYLEKTGDVAGLPFKLHDFGYRGVSSEESAMIGGMAHLVNFMGSDTILALEGALDYYGEEMAGFSIPATEHSVMSALEENGEISQLERFVNTFKDATVPAIACVADTYNIFRFAEDYMQQLKGKIEHLTDKVLVVRPDSGTPHVIVRQVVELLDKVFGHSINEKNYKVLNHVRVIQGDGINLEEIRRILDALVERGWSADNIAFGMGGALLQKVDRDTQKFAIKASSIVINGRVHDVQKRPVTDNGKRSKAGRLKLIYGEDGVLTTVPASTIGQDVLQTVFENGKLLVDPTFAEIRERAQLKTVNPAWL